MMEKHELPIKNSYHIRVVDASDYHRNEWIGNLTLGPHQNGGTWLGISFSASPVLGEMQTQSVDADLPYFSVETIENEDG